MEKITFAFIKKVICHGEKISPGIVFKKTRKKEILFARQLIMHFARKYKIGSQSKVGRLCGGFDHATVLHAERSINNYLDTCKKTAQLIEEYDMVIRGEQVPEYKIDYAKQNNELKKRIKELEDEVFQLQSRLSCVRKSYDYGYAQPYSGYRPHSR